MKVAIIGGGASGLFAAGILNDKGIKVTIFEKNNKLGKKILASGNGKCNFSNVSDLNDKYNNVFANSVIEQFTVEDTLKEFSKMGLIYKNDDQGRCYPVSENASSVLDCLKSRLNGVSIRLDTTIEKIEIANNKVVVFTEGKKETFDYAICCSGSSASNLGSERAYSYLKNIGVNLINNRASLSPVIVRENVKELSGVRVKCLVKLVDDCNKIIYEEDGEILFKDDGLSGIAIFNASSYINRDRNKKYEIILDISNGIEDEELEKYFMKKKKENIFKGFLNDKIGSYLLKYINVNKIDGLIVKKIVKMVKNWKFSVVNLYPLKDAQVCSGGISVNEVNKSLSLKKIPFIYVCGELLDIDGICGGYNLQFAWSSGAVVAKDIIKKVNNKKSKEN